MRYLYILGNPFPMYSIMALFGIAFVVAIGMAKRRAFGLRKRDILLLAAFATIGAFLGAKLFSVIGQIFRHADNPDFWTWATWKHMLNAGFVFYGGLIGGFALAALWAKIGRIDMKRVFDIAAYAAFAFQSLGRFGCYFAGCCYGVLLSGGAQFPVQIFEAGFCFLALLAFLIIRPERRWPSLQLFPVYLIIYSAGRFVLEFFRGDANRGVWILSTSQWIGLALIALAVVWLWKSGTLFRSNKHMEHKEADLCD